VPGPLEAARAAREFAHAPFSHFKVGAALETLDGQIITGCNVENASFGLTICAERAAIFNAVSEGEREFEALAVVTSNGVTPCGACRQVYSEFAKPESQVIISDTHGHVRKVFMIGELLSDGFTPDQLQPGE